MKRVLFIDPVSDRPYRLDSPDQTAPGGTEATLLRVALGLSERDYEIWIAQGERDQEEWDRYGITYLPFRYKQRPDCPQPDAVVCLRAPKIMPWLRRAFPRQRLFLWLHCFPGTRRRDMGSLAERHDFTILAVTHSHASFVEERCGRRPEVVYNPLERNLEEYRTTQKDRDSMIFFSSPHKGLPQVLDTFKIVRRRFPSLTLKVANPGYITMKTEESDGVVDLGPLPHHRVLREVASSFCVFYPQTIFAETFGLVFAEANAVGTPVLAHDLGAAAEVLSLSDQLVDCSDPQQVVERIARWRENGPPRPALDPRFQLDRVVTRWEELLAGESSSLPSRATGRFRTDRAFQAPPRLSFRSSWKPGNSLSTSPPAERLS